MIGRVERARVRLLVQRAAGGRAPRLERDPQGPVRVPSAQRPQRLVDGGRVVREVVVDAHAPRLADELLPAPHAFERREVPAQLAHAGAEALRARRDRRHRVAHVVVSGHAHREAPAGDAAREQIEGLRRPGERRRGSRRPPGRDAAGVVALERVPDDARAGLARHDRARRRVVRVAHDDAPFRDGANERPERRLVGRDVRVDVDVVVLDARDDRDVVRAHADVVEELGLLVPVDRVVLVALDDERRAPLIRPDARRADRRARRQALGARRR